MENNKKQSGVPHMISDDHKVIPLCPKCHKPTGGPCACGKPVIPEFQQKEKKEYFCDCCSNGYAVRMEGKVRICVNCGAESRPITIYEMSVGKLALVHRFKTGEPLPEYSGTLSDRTAAIQAIVAIGKERGDAVKITSALDSMADRVWDFMEASERARKAAEAVEAIKATMPVHRDPLTPSHYAGTVTPWDLQRVMRSSGNPFVDARRADAIKYAFRLKSDLKSDLIKAKHCLQAAIDALETPDNSAK